MKSHFISHIKNLKNKNIKSNNNNIFINIKEYKNFFKSFLILILLSIITVKSPFALADDYVPQPPNKYSQQLTNSYRLLIENIKLTKFFPGAVVASPSQSSPDYFYHWTRDAALTINEAVIAYQFAQTQEVKSFFANIIWNWVHFEMLIQDRLSDNDNYGEPLFTVDGFIVNKKWGRPQNDGPALRALTMIAWTHAIENSDQQILNSPLYKAEMPAKSPIKRDLEFIAHHWQDPCYDIWEEVKGNHFFTLMVQRKALIEGAIIARTFNDPYAADYYEKVVKDIDLFLKNFINKDNGYVNATINWTDGWDTKITNLDSAVILAAVYFYVPGMSFSLESPESEALFLTSYNLEKTFIQKYPINSNHKNLRPLIGRYPEDVYDGIGPTESNPWFLTTLGMAEYNCSLANLTHNPNESAEWRKIGMEYFDRVFEFINSDGHMSEQIHKTLGKQVGAHDLTWSYAAYLRTMRACQPELFAYFWKNKTVPEF